MIGAVAMNQLLLALVKQGIQLSSREQWLVRTQRAIVKDGKLVRVREAWEGIDDGRQTQG